MHHGNGTQWIFYEDPTVLFVSSHQYPFYPGTGAASEKGRGAGLGFTLNIPLEAGAKDDEIERKYAEQVDPGGARLQAGSADDLGRLRRARTGSARPAADDDRRFGRLTKTLIELADEVCDGRVVLVTEGGYDLNAVSECLTAVIEALPLTPVAASASR